jgi:NADPH-dependent curcumin reductase CurA
MCGAISQYSATKPYGVTLTPQLISMKAIMQGVSDPEHLPAL